jgi:Cdc6-like AAA superfamily ATPase
MHDRREPILMCATGKKGVGKTYTTMNLIKNHSRNTGNENSVSLAV